MIPFVDAQFSQKFYLLELDGSWQFELTEQSMILFIVFSGSFFNSKKANITEIVPTNR
jgi:hypothetical protein